MPEKCLFCGEMAVIEESMDGGREQLICIECGSLATGKVAASGPEDFYDDGLDSRSIDSSTFDEEPEPALGDQESSALCSSCGVTLAKNSSLTNICLDCAELSEEEEENGASGSSNKQVVSNSSNAGNQKEDSPMEKADLSNSNSCSSCGGSNLSMDAVGGDDRLVCTDCGMVNSESILTTDSYNPESYTSSKYHTPTLPRFAERHRIQQGMAAGLSRILNLCLKYHFPSSLQTEAEDMFKRLFYHPKVVRVTVIKKEYVAAVCLFLVCRQNDLPISLTHFKSGVGNYNYFLKVKKHVLRTMNINLPHVSLTRKMTDLLDRLKFEPSLMTNVKDLLFLFRRAWLTQGRSRDGLIALAAYYAYTSSDKCKKFISRKQFCITNKLPPLSQKMASECENFLLKLAGSLPWLKSKQITTRTLPMHIKSILRYQESLIHLVFTRDDNVESVIVSATETTLDSQLSTIKNTEENCNLAAKRPLSSQTQKEKLLPVCAKRKKMSCYNEDSYVVKIPSGIDLDSPVLQENEFEEEINSYILTSEEQENLRKAKMSVFGDR